jgi:hypothetical protein
MSRNEGIRVQIPQLDQNALVKAVIPPHHVPSRSGMSSFSHTAKTGGFTRRFGGTPAHTDMSLVGASGERESPGL